MPALELWQIMCFILFLTEKHVLHVDLYICLYMALFPLFCFWKLESILRDLCWQIENVFFNVVYCIRVMRVSLSDTLSISPPTLTITVISYTAMILYMQVSAIDTDALAQLDDVTTICVLSPEKSLVIISDAQNIKFC